MALVVMAMVVRAVVMVVTRTLGSHLFEQGRVVVVPHARGLDGSAGAGG
jgi:hypothetical protein